MKGQLFEYLNDYLTPARKRYEEIMTDPAYIEAELQKGAAKARAHSEPFMQRLRSAVGIMSLVGGVETKTTGVKVKKELNQAEQAKVDAGKAKAIAIAKQRVQQEAQQVALEVEALVKTIKSSSDPKAASEQVLRALQEKVGGAKKKAKKTLQQTLELLKQQLTH